MNLIHELAEQSGVIAAGEYAFRGDRFSYTGQLSEEMARMASIMCRATTMAVHMQVGMLQSLGTDCGCHPARGWMVRGQQYTVCVIGNVFCFVANNSGALNSIMRFMRDRVEHQTGDLV